MSKLLSKFLQNIILPSAMLIVSKIVGLYFAVKFFNLDFFVDNQQESMYSLQIYFTNRADTLLANSVSNITMFSVMGLFTLYFLLRYRFSLMATYSPKTLVKFNKLNLLQWIHSRGNTFLKVLTWIIFLWVASITIIADSLIQDSFYWIGLVAFVVSIIFTSVLVRTFEIEGEIIYPHSKTSKLY